MTIDICPGCGYPKFGPDLCAYCRPMPVLDAEARIRAREPAGGFSDDVAAAPAV